MCGRFVVAPSSVTDVQKFYNVKESHAFDASYNVAPTSKVPVVLESEDGIDREIRMMRWGLIPSWAKDKSIGNKLFNARSETVMEKPAFRKAYEKRRCVIPASGFYEWQKPSKQPYYFTAPDGIFPFAGLWERWNSPEGELVDSFTILTTEANDTVRPVHGRMPVILSHNLVGAWLTSAPDKELLETIAQPFGGSMTVCMVGNRVNSPRNNDPTLINSL